MSVSAKQNVYPSGRPEQIQFSATEEQYSVIEKAADLLGWSVSEYVRAVVLDRAERDLHEHAALHGHRRHHHPDTGEGTIGPFVALLG